MATASSHPSRIGFFRSLFAGIGSHEKSVDPLIPSRDYCQRLLDVYTKLAQQNALVSPLPDWATLSAFNLDVNGLQEVPRLQAALADSTAYTPSKWLLEQELAKRNLEIESVLGAGESPKTWNQSMGDVYDKVQEVGLSGLAFSGGGVRSATFCLGVLQALAEHNELRRFDYLSSVSGGGYIHQWFASWVYNQPPAGQLPTPPSPSKLARVQQMLKPLPTPDSPARWPSQIQWLRRYSSYLTPERGVFSVDTWTMLSNWFRNTFLNQIVLLGFLACCILLVRLLFLPFILQNTGPCCNVGLPWPLIVVVTLVTLYQLSGSVLLGLALNSQKAQAKPGSPAFGALNDGQVFWRVVLPSFLGAFCVALQARFYPLHRWHVSFIVLWTVQIAILLIALVLGGLLPREGGSWQTHRSWIALLSGFTALVIAASIGIGASWLASPWSHDASPNPPSRLYERATYATARINSWLTSPSTTVKLHKELASSAGAIATLEVNRPSSSNRPMSSASVMRETLFGLLAPLVFLGIQFIGVRLQIGILGSSWAECRREWMARFDGWTAIVSLVWLLLGFTTWIGPAIVGWFADTSNWHRIGAVFGIILVHAGTLYAGGSGRSDGQPKPGAFLGYRPIDLVGIIGAPLCVFSLLLILSSIVDGIIKFIWSLEGRNHQFDVTICALVMSLLFLFFGWRVDVNEFSLHGFYRNRLARCYLGATNMMRTPDPFTGFDEHTETRSRTGMAVSDLLPTRFGGKKGFDGPFPIFCSTLNLTFGEDLAYQERKGASFAFTPLFSGYHVGWTAETGRKYPDTTFNGYAPTADFAYRNGGISLASAAAISGAALSPNQGFSSQPALAFLMTLFNIRLGWWIANPRKPKIWPSTENTPTPDFGLRYLLGELFGKANDTSKFVCLCDGGRFENMGLYELVRRRCTFIVVCDAESDANYEFQGIGKAISKCRTDFGAEIDLDLLPLRQNPLTGKSGAHFVEGSIRYPAPAGPHKFDDYIGRVIYVKSTVTGVEPGDILHHKLTHPAFPNDSTLNQWFTESQFESYRRLGQLSGKEAISAFPPLGPPIAPTPPPPPPTPAPAPHIGWEEVMHWIKRQ